MLSKLSNRKNKVKYIKTSLGTNQKIPQKQHANCHMAFFFFSHGLIGFFLLDGRTKSSASLLGAIGNGHGEDMAVFAQTRRG